MTGTLNSRERLIVALNHREPDRVPFDLGGTTATGLHADVYSALRQHLGMTPGTGRILDPTQWLATVEEDMLSLLDVDVEPVMPADPSTWSLDVRDIEGTTRFVDEFGLGWSRTNGNLYFDVSEHPLAGNLTRDRIDQFPWPNMADAARFRDLRQSCELAHEHGRAVVVREVGDGLMEMASWMRGDEQFYVDLAEDPGLASYLLDKLLESKLQYWQSALPVIGDVADVLYSSDDYCGQNGPLIAPRTWSHLFKPRLRDIFSFIHSRTSAKVLFHSCGAVRIFIPDLIEIGVDILNPVQVNAVGMDTAKLKTDFGRELVFWGGGIDTQSIMPSGTVDQVRSEVRSRLDDLMPGGGFVFSTVHNIQPDVPPRNIVAMWETVGEYGRYS